MDLIPKLLFISILLSISCDGFKRMTIHNYSNEVILFSEKRGPNIPVNYIPIEVSRSYSSLSSGSWLGFDLPLTVFKSKMEDKSVAFILEHPYENAIIICTDSGVAICKGMNRVWEEQILKAMHKKFGNYTVEDIRNDIFFFQSSDKDFPIDCYQWLSVQKTEGLQEIDR